MDGWEQFREQMPVASRYAYFDHAAVSPLPAPAAAAIGRWLEEAVDSGDLHWPRWAEQVEHARRHAAEGVHAEIEEIAFVSSTTEGVTFVAEGLDWRQGDQVVVLDNEFPTNIYPWMNLASIGVELVQVPASTPPNIDDLLAACTSKTRLISVSWVGFASGWRIDLDRLVDAAHRRGILVFLDAIQGLGVFPLDVQATPVDFFAADGHKWMLGPEGAGLFFVRREHLDRLRPIKVGWNSVRRRYDFDAIAWDLRDDASRYEGGSQNMAGVHGLGASLQLLREQGWGPQASAVGERVLEISQLADARLRSAGARVLSDRDHKSNRSGILLFEAPGQDPLEARRRASDAGVILSCRSGRLRIAPHAYNNEEDIERLIDVLF